ncbi:MAG: phage terminase large subunit, partial [Nitrososphaera sp.]|nr:phage terminase large subunit [Nitrososphaera sp.]
MNPERREKFRNWFMNALLPAGSDDCLVRVVGTVLHDDSMLERLMADNSWTTLRMDAHSDDYQNILWPGKFSAERLQALYQGYKDQGNPEGYAMEYRNRAIDPSTAFFRKQDLQKITPEMRKLRGQNYTGVDLAISLKSRADFTVIATAKMVPGRGLMVIDVRRDHWDSMQIIEQMIEVHKQYQPELMIMEEGAIEKAIGPFLFEEMRRTGVYINLDGRTPVKDKMARAQSFKARCRAGSVYFDHDADWWPVVEKELLAFPRGRNDDIVDTLSWIGLALDDMVDVDSDEEEAEANWRKQEQESLSFGRSMITGY